MPLDTISIAFGTVAGTGPFVAALPFWTTAGRTVHRVLRPSVPLRVAEQPTGRELLEPASSDLDGRFRQINHARFLFSLRLGFGKHPSPVLEIEVPSFHPQRFLRTAASLPGDDDQIAKRLIPHQFQKLLVLLDREHRLTVVGPGSFQMLDRTHVQVPLFYRPLTAPLHATDVVSAGRATQVRVAVHPLLDVVRLQVSQLEIRPPVPKPESRIRQR